MSKLGGRGTNTHTERIVPRQRPFDAREAATAKLRLAHADRQFAQDILTGRDCEVRGFKTVAAYDGRDVSSDDDDETLVFACCWI